MADVTARVTGPISNNPGYLVKGAIGGYIGAFALAKYYKYDNIDPMGRYLLESAVAGAVGDYLWLMLLTDSVDTDSMWKGVLIGMLGQLIYNRWIKYYVTGYST
jgi:hypothetical protein